MPNANELPCHLAVPVSESDITSHWLQQVLSDSFPGIVVEGLRIKQIGQGYGLASQIYGCHWHGSGTLHRAVIKLWPTDGPGGTREVLFYRIFGQELGARNPACYYAALDSDSERGILILADLNSVVQGDDLRQLSLTQSLGVARQLAGIHATWLEHKALHEADWLPSVAIWERGPDWFAPRRTVFLERFGERLDDRARLLLNRIELAPAISNERLIGAPLTLLHEDLHLDNIVFVNSVEPILLDWARCAKGPLALDLYELLFKMASPSDRESVLSTYLNEFGLRTGQVLDPAVVWHQLGGVFLRKFSMSTCGVANWQPATDREIALIEVSLVRTLDALRYWSEFDSGLFSFLFGRFSK